MRSSNTFRLHRTSRFSGRIGATVIVAVVLLVCCAVALNWLYARWVVAPAAEHAEQNERLFLQMVGLHEPVTNRLDPRFTDADADLVADAPTDPAKQIDPEALAFCYIAGGSATDESDDERERWRPLMNHLSKVTGKRVEYAALPDAKAQLRALRDGKLHVTGLNTGNVALAVNQCGFVPVCVLPTSDGSGLSRMRLIVPADSAIRAPADLKGHELTLTEPGSNSGYKAALVLLRSDFGLLPARDYTIRYSQGHPQSIAAVAEHHAEIAAVSDDMLERAVAAGMVKKDQYRSVYESEKFPSAGLGYAYNLKPDLAAKVREALTTFDWKGTPLEKQLGASAAGATKFVPANYKNDWAVIRRIDDASGQVYQIEDQPPAAPETATTQTATTEPTSPAPAGNTP